MARPLAHPAAKDVTLDGVLHALSDPVRRGILFRLMGCDGMNCASACEQELPRSTVSFHYRVLREAGLIRCEKRGVELICVGRKPEIEQRFPGLLHAVFLQHQASGKQQIPAKQQAAAKRSRP